MRIKPNLSKAGAICVGWPRGVLFRRERISAGRRCWHVLSPFVLLTHATILHQHSKTASGSMILAKRSFTTIKVTVADFQDGLRKGQINLQSNSNSAHRVPLAGRQLLLSIHVSGVGLSSDSIYYRQPVSNQWDSFKSETHHVRLHTAKVEFASVCQRNLQRDFSSHCGLWRG